MPKAEQLFLREWFRLANIYPPGPDEELPLDFTQALADLAREQGRGKLLHGRRQVASSNRSRKVVVRKGQGALAT